MRVLERNAEITTRYGGGFVQSIDGLEGDERRRRLPRLVLLRQRGRVDGRRRRLLAARRRGDLVGLPRLVGGDAGAGRGRLLAAAVRRRLRRASAHPVAVECRGGGAACARSRGSGCGGAGVDARRRAADGAIRVLVGPWARLRADPAAAQIEAGPQASGVFADFERARRRLRG